VAATTKIAVLASVIGLAAGIGIGVHVAQGKGSNTPVSVSSEPPVHAGAGVATPQQGLSAQDREALRELIRSELANGKADAALTAPPRVQAEQAPAPAPDAADEAAQLSDQQLQTFDAARSLVDAALARRTWTAADREQLHAHIGSLPPRLQIDVARPIIAAINRDQVRFDGDGPPF
jgi:hypothetical protein